MNTDDRQPVPGAEPAADAVLQVHALNVTLGRRTVLRGIDLRLPRGEIVALLGPSGCGKTTLLRSIAGLEATQSGHIRIGGRDVAGLRPQARGIGMMFQNYALFPNLSVRDNIAFGPLAQGWSAERTTARTDKLLTLIELQAHAEQRPAQLSGGQRQRVAMARALAPEPALLLMDEPFSAIDESFRLPLRRAFRQLQQALGQSCVIVTHDREEAFELADRVAVMLDGRIARIDTPAALLLQPRDRAVARFLGAFNIYPALPADVLRRWAARPHQHQRQHPSAACAGPWAAPMHSLEPAGEPGGDGWTFEAEVVARHGGLRSAVLDLQLPDGQLLQALEGRRPCLPGERGRWVQPLQALSALSAPNEPD
jgi:ABC-type Fe3+/spermidine/putrescine transport system ATPase subunit